MDITCNDYHRWTILYATLSLRGYVSDFCLIIYKFCVLAWGAHLWKQYLNPNLRISLKTITLGCKFCFQRFSFFACTCVALCIVCACVREREIIDSCNWQQELCEQQGGNFQDFVWIICRYISTHLNMLLSLLLFIFPPSSHYFYLPSLPLFYPLSSSFFRSSITICYFSLGLSLLPLSFSWEYPKTWCTPFSFKAFWISYISGGVFCSLGLKKWKVAAMFTCIDFQQNYFKHLLFGYNLYLQVIICLTYNCILKPVEILDIKNWTQGQVHSSVISNIRRTRR